MIAQLRGLGLTPVLLTGDDSRAAHAVAAQVGITRPARGPGSGRHCGWGWPPRAGLPATGLDRLHGALNSRFDDVSRTDPTDIVEFRAR